MNRQHLTLYGLKWNPFATDLPVDGLMTTPAVDSFCKRIEHHLVRQGGFALIAGEPGTGKSVALRLLAHRLKRIDGLRVAVLTHPSSQLGDFYREMGDLFGIELLPTTAGAGSATCASDGSPISMTPACARCCSSTRPRKHPTRCSPNSASSATDLTRAPSSLSCSLGDNRLLARLRV